MTSRARILVSATLALIAFVITFLTLYTLAVAHWHGPFRDMWEIYPFLIKIIDETWSLKDLWESYGYSHRLFFPKLLFIADHQFFDATNHLLIAVSIVCQILICGLFSILLWRDNSISAPEKYALISILVCLQFSATLLFNFMHTFDVQWFLCCFFVVAAHYQMCHLSSNSLEMTDKSRSQHLALSGLLIAVACLNNFSGMAAWPIWLLLVFARLQHLKLKILFAILSVLFIALYAFGIRGTHMDLESISELFKFLAYVFVTFPLAYLANPLSDTDFTPVRYLALLVVIPALYILAKFWTEFLLGKSDRKQKPLAFFLAGIGLFGYGVAVITAIGRGYDPSHVHAMRYQNIVMLFWSAVILFAILESRYYLIRSRFLLLSPFILTFAGFLWCQTSNWGQNIWLGYQVNRAHLALMMGYAGDVPMIAPTVSRSMIYVPGYNLERERALYEQARMGIYHGELASVWLKGISIPTIPQRCTGRSWSLSPHQGTYSSYTRFLVSGDTAAFSQAALVNKAGKVLAIAIPDVADSLVNSLRVTLGFYNPVFKGFAIPGDQPYALVMLRASGDHVICTDLIEDGAKKEAFSTAPPLVEF